MRIVVTGIGLVSALGIGKEANREALLNERSGIAAPRILGTVHRKFPVGEVRFTNDELKEKAGIDSHVSLPRTSLLGILAAREALQQACVLPDNETAFVSGTTVGGMDLTEQHWNEYVQGMHTETVPLHEAGESTKCIADHLSPITNHQSPFAFTATPSTACSSALNAVMMGADMLRTGVVRKVLAGGSESLSLFHFNGFRSLMILDQEPCRPFDASRAGLNLGEGAGYLLLEREEDALERGAQILAYIGGYANTCDAFHQSASSENGEGAYLAMKGALKMAGLQPTDIEYINAHGTATPNNDLSESAALLRLFGDAMPAVSSTKAFTGHTTSASGGLEAAICVLAMQHGFVPANLHWSETAEGLIRPVLHTEHRPLRHVLCNSFGFGGNESSLLLSADPVDLSESDSSDVSMTLTERIEQNTLDDQAEYMSPLEARRMTPQTRRMVIAAHKALRAAGIDMPDAIVCATQWGCLKQSMLFLTDMLQSREQEAKPTYFMQSTHNTIASTIAIRIVCHGYNNTYSQGKESLDCALEDVRCQMALGRIRTALVLEFDEKVELWDQVLCHLNRHTEDIARAYVYKRQ